MRFQLFSIAVPAVPAVLDPEVHAVPAVPAVPDPELPAVPDPAVRAVPAVPAVPIPIWNHEYLRFWQFLQFRNRKTANNCKKM